MKFGGVIAFLKHVGSTGVTGSVEPLAMPFVLEDGREAVGWSAGGASGSNTFFN